MTIEYTNPHKQLQEIGAEMKCHENALYVRSSAEAQAIIKASGYFHSFFRGLDGHLWIAVEPTS